MTGDHDVENQRRQIEVQPSAQAERGEADAEPQAVQECGTAGETGGGFGAEASGGVIRGLSVAMLKSEAQDFR